MLLWCLCLGCFTGFYKKSSKSWLGKQSLAMENHKNGISPERWFSTALFTDFFQVLTIIHRRRQWKGFFFSVFHFFVSNSTLFVVCLSFTLAACDGNRGSNHTQAKMQPLMEINHGINVLRNHRIHELRNCAIHVLRNHRTRRIDV
jgi:hypothetical protein